jgi:hypothetical protein
MIQESSNIIHLLNLCNIQKVVIINVYEHKMHKQPI